MMRSIGRWQREVGASRPDIESDRYIGSILAQRSPPGSAPATEPTEAAEEVRAAADLLREALVRFHPSFRFEERLAATLAGASAGAPAQTGSVIPFRRAFIGSADDSVDEGGAAERRARGYLVGGAIASTVSIASIWGALIYWRRVRGYTERSA